MADGVVVHNGDTGTGTAFTAATDDAGAAGQVQIVKFAISADGSATHIPATVADGLLVNLGANNDVTISGGSVTATEDRGTFTTSTAAPTDASATQVLASNANRIVAMILNNSDGIVYVGASGVSSTTGIPLEAGQSFTDTRSTSAWYCRCATGVTGDLRIVEVA